MKRFLYIFILLIPSIIFADNIEQNLSLYLPFCANSNDMSGNSRHASLNGARLTNDRFNRANNAYYFDGNDDYMIITNQISDLTGDFTVCFWIKTTQVELDPWYFGKMLICRDECGFLLDWSVAYGNDSKIQFMTGTPGEKDSVLVSNSKVNSGNWTHVAVVRQGINKYIYINGNLDASAQAPPIIFENNNLSISLGRPNCDPNSNRSFDGSLDEIRIYTRALNNNEVIMTRDYKNLPNPLSAIPSVLDFGEIFCKESIILNLTLKNNSNNQYINQSISLYNGINSPFKILADPYFSLNPGSERTIAVEFKPLSSGIYNDTLIFSPDNCYDLFKIPLKAFKHKIDFSINNIQSDTIVIDFGNVCAESFKDTNIVFKNLSDISTKFGKLNSNSSFEFVPVNIFDKSYNAGEEALQTIRFKSGLDTGSYMSMITIRDTCGKSRVLKLKATVNSININMPKYVSICVDSALVLNPIIDFSKEPYKYIYWSPSAGLNKDNILNPTLKLSKPGRYVYKLTIVDLKSCIAEDSIIVNVRYPIQTSIKPSSLDFGRIGACEQTKLDSIEISNDGLEDIIIENTDITGDFSIIYPKLPIIINKGDKIKFGIEFNAKKSGLHKGNLKFSFGPCYDYKTIELSGFKNNLLITSNLNNIDFGPNLSCSPITVDTSFTIKNESNEDITLDFSKFKLNPPFTLISPLNQKILKPNESVTVCINYKSLLYSNYDTLKIEYNGSQCKDTLEYKLAGIVEKAIMNYSSQSYNFGVIGSCQNYIDTSIIVSNKGNIDLTIVKFSPESEFICQNKLPIILKPTDSVELKFRYTPKNTGYINSSLVINFEPCNSAVNINIDGRKEGQLLVVNDEIDFGEIIECKEKNKTIVHNILLESTDNTNASIAELSIDSPFSTNLKKGDILKPNENLNFEVNASIDNNLPDGLISGNMKIIFEPCKIEKNIRLKVYKFSTSLIKFSDLDFGLLVPNEKKVLIAKVFNKGSKESLINNVQINNSKFKIVKTIPEMPATLKSNDTLYLEIEYTPNIVAEDLAILTVSSKFPCNQDLDINIKGTCNNDFKPLLESSSAKAKPGEIIQVPIYLSHANSLVFAGANSIEFDLSYNASLLAPLDSDKGEISNNIRTHRCKYDLKTDEKGVLANLNFYVGLGDKPETYLMISNVKLNGANNIIDTSSGKFILDGICYEGGARLINPKSRVYVKSSIQNESIIIKFVNIEKEASAISIYNVNGELVYRYYLNDSELAKENLLILSKNSFTNGLYIIVLNTPTIFCLDKIMIVK